MTEIRDDSEWCRRGRPLKKEGEGEMIEEKAIKEILEEYSRAVSNNGSFHSAHEGLAVIWEEFEELKAEVWKKRTERDLDKMQKEACQIAAMGLRFMVDICLKKKGRGG